jgi:hypothetical protein
MRLPPTLRTRAKCKTILMKFSSNSTARLGERLFERLTLAVAESYWYVLM